MQKQMKLFLSSQEEKEQKDESFSANLTNEVKVKRGEVWILGNHRLMCGNSTSETDIKKLLNGNAPDMIFADPPYGMKKEKSGVIGDNANYEDLLTFNRQWIPLCVSFIKENGSFYCWGTAEPLMDIYSSILKPLINQGAMTFRNLITWSKGDAQGELSESLRSYAINSEKCLFLMKGQQGFNVNSDHYFEGWEPIRSYLEEEARKVGLTNEKLFKICNVASMFSHWFTKSQWTLIPEKHYNQLKYFYKNKAFKKEYEEIKKEYEEIKKEEMSKRAYFDNTHEKMNEVWQFRPAKEYKETDWCGGHATPKPLVLCNRAVLTSCPPNGSVLDPFCGSGSCLISCELNGRKCFAMELSEKWCSTIIARWEYFSGKKAILEAPDIINRRL